MNFHVSSIDHVFMVVFRDLIQGIALNKKNVAWLNGTKKNNGGGGTGREKISYQDLVRTTETE